MHPHGPASPVSRRDFLRVGALGGIAIAGARPRPRSATDGGPDRRDAIPAFELEEWTFAQLQDAMARGAHTARSITEAYLARIDALDRQGPTLRHVLETNPDALAIADALDEERRAGRVRGPLHGMPILVKDNIDTADRMSTTAGSYALLGTTRARDAFVIERLRAAGAIILGKASLSEWANFRSSQSSSGWCARGGQGKNPYALDRSPCGSSSGSGSATAANLCAAAVGTETDGSIVCPSATNGIVGIKPTLGLVSRSGIVPIAHSQDTAGPMARTVTDAAILLGAMTGTDPRDAASQAAQGRAQTDYTQTLDPGGLRGARIGVMREGVTGYSPETDAVFEDALAALRDAGATLVDPADIPTRGQFGGDEFTVLLYEFKADLNAYLAALGPDAPVKTLEDAIRFNEANADREMPYFGQEIFESAQEKGPLTETAYREALERAKRLSGPEGIDAIMDEHRLDALVAPTGAPAWTVDLINGDHFLGGSSSAAAVAGYPNITVPAGYRFGLPVGISFMGRAWSEATLLRLAYAFEQATNVRHAPTFREHALWS